MRENPKCKKSPEISDRATFSQADQWQILVMSYCRLMLPLIVPFILVGCGGEPDAVLRKRHTEALPACFRILERLEVEAYRNQDWCKNIVYKRGKFSRNKEVTCNLFRGTPMPFDSQAEKDFDAVAKVIRTTGVPLMYITGSEYAPKGALKRVEFHLDGGPNRYSYVYSIGYTNLPPDDPGERRYTAINRDWYYVWEDWN